MKNESIWKKDLQFNILPSLTKDINIDVLIIGGGIAGISALYYLKQTNLNVALVERNICGMGVTARSTAKITYLQQDLYQKINFFVNEDAAKLYLKSQITAVKALVDIIEKEKINCDLEVSPSYLFTNDNNNLNKLNEEYFFLRDNNVSVQKVKKMPLNEKFISALKVNDTYTFHPLKYINHLKNKYKNSIYEHSKVLKIEKGNNCYSCLVNENTIKAKYIIMATHYPYFLIPFMMPLKCSIETSYIGTKRINNKNSFNAINIDKPCISFRTYQCDNKKHLIYLYQSMPSSNIKNINDNFKYLVQKGFASLWSNKDIITNDFLPFVGSLKKNDNSILIAMGFNTWGITNGTLAGKILADIILKKDNPYIELFAPHRNINLGKLIHFPLDLEKNAKAFIKSNRFNTNNENVIYTKKDGRNVIIYKDKKGKEHIVLNRCPHMKCGLVLNEIEQTWDCYCHGSRFDIDGNVIEGPSNFDIKFKSE